MEDIEETFKTRFSYTLSSAYPEDPLIYTRKMIYADDEMAAKSNKLFSKIKKANSNLPFVKHHYKKYGKRLPIWVAVEIMTLGHISTLYENLLPVYKKAIAKKYNTGAIQLENWIINMRYTRNHLAHYMRIYNYSFGRIPKACKNHPIEATYTGKIFDQIAVMSFLYSKPGEWNNYILPQMKDLIHEYRGEVSLEGLGFPENWYNMLVRPI